MEAIPDNEFKLLQRSIHNQRYQMELALETMPREVYSNQLMEAMRREEKAVREGVKVTRESVAAIDEMLRSETAKFYRKIWKENEKRWLNLQSKVDNEYLRFFQSGSRQGGNRSGCGSGSDKSSVRPTQSIASTSTTDGDNAATCSARAGSVTAEQLGRCSYYYSTTTTLLLLLYSTYWCNCLHPNTHLHATLLYCTLLLYFSTTLLLYSTVYCTVLYYQMQKYTDSSKTTTPTGTPMNLKT